MVDALTREDFVEPEGEVRGVSYRLQLAWIDLGRADGVRRRLPFGVYPAGTCQLSGGTRKGTVEVTQVLDEHLAETRIVDDRTGDPIMRGDKVHRLPPSRPPH